MEFCRKPEKEAKEAREVKGDCEELLRRFQQTGSVRFEVFSGIWREMKFSQIFLGTGEIKARRFAQLILNTAGRFFLPPFSFQIRVGGLYLLHGLYHTQEARPTEQIRLALKDWEHVKKFEEDALDAQHLDVVYILRRLVFHRAFYFTAMPTLLSFKKKRQTERTALCDEFVERASRPQELINAELLEELSNIHDLYEKMKTSVAPASGPGAPSVDLSHKDFVSQLRGTVMDFYEWQQKKGDEDEDSGEGTSSQQECSDRAELLATIKSKAFGQAAEASRSRRHRQVELDVAGNKAGPSSQSSVHPRVPKLSLKARTDLNIRISGDMRNEATTTTSINRLTAVVRNLKKEQE